MRSLLLLAFAVVVVPACATVTTTTLKEIARWPFYRTNLTIENVQKDSTVAITLPYNYHVVTKPTITPAAVTCVWSHRTLFNEEFGSAKCDTGHEDLRAITVAFNGTAVFLPVRFPVIICGYVNPDRCWTNEHIWSTPSPLEQLVSCEVVAIVVLVFWSLAGCMICVCMRRVIWAQPLQQKRPRFVIGEEVELLTAASRTTYKDNDDDDDNSDGDGDDKA